MSKYVPSELVTLFVTQWNKDNDGWRQVNRERINFGWCYQFAMLMKKLHGEGVKLCYDTGHAWVKIEDKYYDSDTPEGSCNFKDLSGPPHGMGLREDVAPEEFEHFWRNGGSGTVDHNVIDSVIKLFYTSRIGA
jgi:sugar phosphate isomerase/epimerase